MGGIISSRSMPTCTSMENGSNFSLTRAPRATCLIKRNEVPRETKIMPTAQMITLYDGSRVKPYGKCKVKVTNPRLEKTYDVEFVVIQDAQNSILGSATVQQMGLLTVHHERIQKIATDKDVKPRSKEHTHTQCCKSTIQYLRRQSVF